ncbi:MAG: hypothetical protein JW754_02225 [Candidatus Aenigmarchaeota archaeon]|nr:hypothetical protein [Candidatus Aenigmarchaeota archaeon]
MKKLVTDVKIRSAGWGGDIAILETFDGMHYQVGQTIQTSQIHDYMGGIENSQKGGKTFVYVK